MKIENFKLMHKILNIIDKYEELDDLINSLTEEEFKYFLTLMEKSAS